MNTKIALLPLTLATLTGACTSSTDDADEVTKEEVTAQDPDATGEATPVRAPVPTTQVRPAGGSTTPKLDGDSKDGP